MLVVTGVSSGLGRHIHEALGGIGVSRDNAKRLLPSLRLDGVDTIVHCAFNSSRDVSAGTLYGYIEDNVMLTAELVRVPHRKFIFISTLDVYPKSGITHSETDDIDVNAVQGIYGLSKLMSEAIVRRRCRNHLILRVSGLLGTSSRRNSLIRIIEDDECILTLSGNARFNYILHSSVSDVVAFAVKRDMQGIYNAASRENITLEAVAEMLGKKVTFGDYHYDVGDINNGKIAEVFPVFRKTSKEVVLEYAAMRKGCGLRRTRL